METVNHLTYLIFRYIMFPFREQCSLNGIKCKVHNKYELIMKIIGLGILDDYCRSHVEITSQISAWLAEVKAANWSMPSNIKEKYRSSSFLPNNHVVFNIKGNKFRLDTKVYYPQKTIVIKRLGTHAEYNKWKY